MLDFRHETFLALCSCNSFTKAAELLHITQPAVSQHIKYLEEYYGCKLFDTTNRKIRLTHQGELLKEFAMTVFSDSKHFKENISSIKTDTMQFSFGATLSIGEYVMPEILSSLLIKYPEMKIHMSVANTQVLLERLNSGGLDFIVVEGLFDKSEYDSTLFSSERFIPVCSPNSEFAKKEVDFKEITTSRLILRERGSGTREIFENILQKNNYTLHAFKSMIEIGNMAAIKKMVSNGLGITFLYEVAVKHEIENGSLSLINIPDFSEQREFNFVMLKNSFFRERYMQVYELLKQTFGGS
ncbi:MAG: LysR family transcriptional regulator [Oscillospiraceae bacterium]|nr:LysR family transcriptional regulator [Oscillospiraceae bacterium]MDD3833663.1 LysR family transcriptional regulator [Oscillospiraceae bacterium]MDD4546893.1 LysR family transcriptional regulator [Oscillospiraceae bacterium]